MPEEHGLFPVNAALVRETLVENLHAEVEKRRWEGAPARIRAVLEDEPGIETGCQNEALDRGLRLSGYLARIVEAEMFEPARQTADWIPEMLEERFADTGSWARAVAEACVDLANSEPLAKPNPDDERARTWRVPGPGGHVRHFAASRAIGEELSKVSATAEIGDPSELKRLWLYGFFVRACEEALPAEAEIAPEE